MSYTEGCITREVDKYSRIFLYQFFLQKLILCLFILWLFIIMDWSTLIDKNSIFPNIYLTIKKYDKYTIAKNTIDIMLYCYGRLNNEIGRAHV